MKHPKIIVVGFDAVSLEIIQRYADSGDAPTLKKLMKNGTYGHALSCFPNYTPTNWACLSTGAQPGNTSAGDWHNSLTAKRLSTFDSRAISCETIWKSAAKQKLKTLAVQYPSSYPPYSKKYNYTLVPLDKGLASNFLYTGKIVEIKMKKIKRNIYEGILDIVSKKELNMIIDETFKAKIVGATEDGVKVQEKYKINKLDKKGLSWKIFAEKINNKWKSIKIVEINKNIKTDKWSDFFLKTIPSSNGSKEGIFRLKPFSKSKDSKITISISEIYDVDYIVSPKELKDDILKNVGGFFEHTTFNMGKPQDLPFNKGNIILDPDFDFRFKELVDELSYQVGWYIKSARYMLKKVGWDIY